METRICREMRSFLETYGLPAKRLAVESGIAPCTITMILTGKRKDLTAEKADKVRATMKKIAIEINKTDTPNDCEGEQ